jgi:hypothetical protein
MMDNINFRINFKASHLQAQVRLGPLGQCRVCPAISVAFSQNKCSKLFITMMLLSQFRVRVITGQAVSDTDLVRKGKDGSTVNDS